MIHATDGRNARRYVPKVQSILTKKNNDNFFESPLCNLWVVFRSRVLRGVHDLMKGIDRSVTALGDTFSESG